MIQNQFQTDIQILRTDNGTDYFNSILGPYLKDHGIIHQSSCVDTPQQNSIAERKNRHLLEVARSLMFTTHMPKRFWGKAILTTVFLVNQMPSRILIRKTPLDTLLQSYPNSRLHQNLPLIIFGCTSFVHYTAPGRSKLEPRAIKCVLLGYPSTKHGYKCFDPISGKLFITMDVKIFEKKPYFPITTLQGENMSEDCFQETSSPQLPNSPPAGQLPPLLLESPTTTESRVPLMLENFVIGEDTNSLPAEPPKQQFHVYSWLQQQIELNTSQANQRSEPERTRI